MTYRLAPSVVLAVSGLFGTGCYAYHAADVAAVRPSEVVHVVLSPEAAVALKPSIGPNALTLDARVIGLEAERLRLAVTQIERSVGPEEFLQGEPLDLPLSGASSISVRRFDRARTILAVVGILGSAIAAASFANEPTIAGMHGGPGGSTR
jgi:hypothetical protein